MKLFILLTLFTPFSLAADKMLVEQKPVTAAGVATMWVNWLKDKESKYDFELVIKNETEKSMIVFLHDISCMRGKMRGEVKHTFFNTGEKTMDFKPGERKSFTLVCRYGAEMRGDFTVEISRFFDNPSNDGKTFGKAIAKDLKWTKTEL